MALKLFAVVVIAWLAGQLLKLMLRWHQYRRANLWVFLEDGGMPSLHATVLAALTTAVGYETGVSPLFVAVLFVSAIILSNLLKAKVQPGIQPELMARFIDVREIFRRKLTESIGHTPEQVFVGAIIGFLIAFVSYAF